MKIKSEFILSIKHFTIMQFYTSDEIWDFRKEAEKPEEKKILRETHPWINEQRCEEAFLEFIKSFRCLFEENEIYQQFRPKIYKFIKRCLRSLSGITFCKDPMERLILEYIYTLIRSYQNGNYYNPAVLLMIDSKFFEVISSEETIEQELMDIKSRDTYEKSSNFPIVLLICLKHVHERNENSLWDHLKNTFKPTIKQLEMTKHFPRIKRNKLSWADQEGDRKMLAKLQKFVAALEVDRQTDPNKERELYADCKDAIKILKKRLE